MTAVPVDFHGVHVLGPERFLCAILRPLGDDKLLPIWLSPLEGAKLAAEEAGESTRRPGTHDLLADVLSRDDSGVSSVELTSYHEGTFIATITSDSGSEFDARASDALILAHMLDIQVYADEDVVSQAAVYVPVDELEEYLGFSFDEDSTKEVSASGDADADADFEAMMRSLGVSEDDLGGTDSDDEDKED